MILDSDIKEDIVLSDFDISMDIYKFLKDKHIKITGLSLIKRNTTNMLKRYYLKLIEEVLN